ncbi:MAG: hypothetical protein Q7S48_01585 [bacterium]|nr:hypothetical protein [bacterium]
MVIFIVIAIILAAIAVIGIIAVRKFPQLASMNIEQSPAEKLKRVKEKIAIKRIMRQIKIVKKKVVTPENWARVKYVVRDAYQKLKLLEEKYKVHTSEGKIQLFLKRGRGALADDLELAEQCFLDVITLDPRNLESYESLLQIYLSKRQVQEAVELLDFLVKLNSGSSGRYLFEVAGALLRSGDSKGAWQYGVQAGSFEPTNPKYLDFLLELAILEKHKREGEKYLEELREVNPENGKIEEFEKRLGAI